MRKLILLPLFAMLCTGAKAQVTSLNEQFNNASNEDSVYDRHGTYNHYPAGWSCYSVVGAQDWRWESAYGVGNSGCMHINGYQAGASNANENWLFTPSLTLSSYTGSIYFNFAASYYYAGDSLHIMASHDYVPGTAPNFNNPDSAIYHWTELAHYGVMLYDTFYNITGMYDEFQCDLTPFKSSPVIVAFKYTSDVANASVWDVDSVTTGTVSFGAIESVTNIAKEDLSLKAIGISTPNQVRLDFNVDAGEYELSVYDIIGQRLYDKNINLQSGEQTYFINNANLVKGMYFIKLSNESSYGVTRTLVE